MVSTMQADAAATMLRAAAHFDAAAATAVRGYEVTLPKLLFRGRAVKEIVSIFQGATNEAMRGVRALEPLGAPFEDARTGVTTALREIDPTFQYAIENMRSYTAAQDVPAQLRMQADRLRLRTELDALEPAVARDRMQAQLDGILTLPDAAVSAEQRWRVGVMWGLPAHQRPAMPELVRDNYSFEVLAVRGWSPVSESMARGEWHNLRLCLQRRTLAADPTVTRASLDAEVRAIIATPDAQVTPAMNERLSMIAGLEDDLRPAIVDVPVPWPQHKLSNLSGWNWQPGTNSDARAKYDALRMAVEQEAMIVDPAVTRRSVTDELMELLSLPNELLTDGQVRRVSLLARLPETLRPVMPTPIQWTYRIEDLGLLGYHPARHKMSEKVFDLARVHMAAVVDPELAAKQLKARIDAGDQIDIRVISALSGHGDLLERAGLTQDVLHRQAVRALAGAGSGSTDALRINLEMVRDTISRTAPAADPGVATLRTQALELAERNLDRMSGKRTDTFARHPDYAEIGRFVAIADLLDALRPAASEAVETLTW